MSYAEVRTLDSSIGTLAENKLSSNFRPQPLKPQTSGWLLLYGISSNLKDSGLIHMVPTSPGSKGHFVFQESIVSVSDMASSSSLTGASLRLGQFKEKFSFSSSLELFIHKVAFPSNLGTNKELHCKWGPEQYLVEA